MDWNVHKNLYYNYNYNYVLFVITATVECSKNVTFKNVCNAFVSIFNMTHVAKYVIFL